MSDQFDEILESAKQLSAEEKKRLVQELIKPASPFGNSRSDQSLGAALRRRGLLGSITDAPPDFGTNPEYMKGFGTHGHG